MEDFEEGQEDPKAKKKKKGGFMKKLVFILLGMVLVGGGVGGGLYAMNAGLFGGGHGGGEGGVNAPTMVPKDQQKRMSINSDEHGGGGGSHSATPMGKGGDKYASNYYAMEKEFTSNLQDSVHFVQVGIAISTPYDDRVLDNIKMHEIAIRSAILLALGETSEEEAFTADGKKAMQARLVKAINGVLQQKEGFGGVSNVYFTNFIVQ